LAPTLFANAFGFLASKTRKPSLYFSLNWVKELARKIGADLLIVVELFTANILGNFF
jgi:hypothetical protein